MTFLDWFLGPNSAGVLTAGGAAVALLIYFDQQCKARRDAARIILLEIENAEQALNEILRSNNGEAIGILPVSSWDKYAHYFIGDLDSTELRAIKSFYDASAFAQQELERIQNSVNVALVAKETAIQAKLVELAYINKDDADRVVGGNPSQYLKDREGFKKIINWEDYDFEALAPRMKLKNCIERIKILSTNSVGSKLKKISRQ